MKEYLRFREDDVYIIENIKNFLPDKADTYRRKEKKVGRNKPCPCGSGKKFKRCCIKILNEFA